MPNTAQIVGSGPNKVICLNGWFGHARGWGPLMHSLDTQHFNYAFMDYRGYGARKGSGGPYTIAQIGHDVLALADHLGWQRFSLVGHSMGGRDGVAARGRRRVSRNRSRRRSWQAA